jgi:hypothetical protein
MVRTTQEKVCASIISGICASRTVLGTFHDLNKLQDDYTEIRKVLPSFDGQVRVLVIIGGQDVVMPHHSLSKGPKINMKENIIIPNKVVHTWINTFFIIDFIQESTS